jgi:lipopolysaccharide export system protein LptA
VRPPILFVALFVALGSPAAHAQFESDSSAPIEITADTMEWKNVERIAIARGNADAIQGRYHLHADVLTAHLGEGEGGTQDKIRLIEADGNVRLSTPTETASGETGDYDVERKRVVLEGGVVLTQGETVMRGERLVMDLVTGVSTLEGRPTAASEPTTSATGGRVSVILHPENESTSGGDQ